MKNFLIILLALIIGGGGGYFAWKYLAGRGGEQPRSEAITTENYREPFMWGITMRSTSLGRYIDTIWLKQIKLASNLGVKWVRLAWSFDAPDQFAFNDEIIKYLKDNGLQVYLIIEPPKFDKIRDPYQDGFNNAFRIASHLKGQIKYYQIMNEASGNAIKSGSFSGENDSDYDPTKYARTRDWIKGALDGVHKADPSAYTVISAQWLHVGFLDKLKDDNVAYDIIGWDWFSDMGFMGDKKLSNGTLLIDKLKSYGKPLILAEINYRPEGKNGQKGQPEAKQASFIQKMADWSVQAGLKGFYVLELLDNPNSGNGYTDYYGIVGVKQSVSGVWSIGNPRQAYTTYQEIIKKYSK